MRTGAKKKKDESGNRESLSLRVSTGRPRERKVARYTSSKVGHGESWPENPWQIVKKKQYKVQCK